MKSSLFAVSDLHVSYAKNRRIVNGVHSDSGDDWLIVAGDVGEILEDVVETLALLRRRFSTVIWTPGNDEPCSLRAPRERGRRDRAPAPMRRLFGAAR
ncbi:metallophosphoesterase [Rugosimonospora africana]|nr:metallophosphoesterase family protein [Rugosimonospora africana]